MNDIKLVLYHPTLDILSDRTFRDFLKKLSSLTRNIQAQEVFNFINNSFLDSSEKQSIRDRITPKLNHVPGYYVKRLEKGSLEVVVVVTASALWLLQTIIGEAIKDASKKTRLYKDFVKYLSSNIREENISNNIDSAINNWNLERIVVDNVKKHIDEDDHLVVEVLLKSLLEEIKDKEIEIDTDSVIRRAKKIIEGLEKELNGDRN